MKILFLQPFHKTIIRKFYNNLTTGWVASIGLEVHAQINSKTKLFSPSRTDYFSPPNTNVSFFDCSLPGTLPVINKHCVESAIKAGLALNCNISSKCSFDRKHYFYPDLPFGYQITQKREPIASNGFINFVVHDKKFEAYEKNVSIKQIQLEQDSGKSLRDYINDCNLIDLNRYGIGLIEIIFEPTCRTPLEALFLLQELITILKRINVCSCKMEESALRIDVNVSLAPQDDDELGTRVEIKNLNSFNSILRTLNYELKRQYTLLAEGKSVQHETRFYNPMKYETVSMREKESISDYRFMPEPNLPPIHLSNTESDILDEKEISIPKIREQLPILPQSERNELIKNYNIDLLSACLIVNANLINFYKEAVSKSSLDKTRIAEIISKDLLETYNDSGHDLETISINIDFFVIACDLLEENIIDKGVFYDMVMLWIGGCKKGPKELLITHGWEKINDEVEINRICKHIIDENPKIALYAKLGKPFFVQKLAKLVQAETGSRLHWKIAMPVLETILETTLKSYLKKLAKQKKKEMMESFQSKIEN